MLFIANDNVVGTYIANDNDVGTYFEARASELMIMTMTRFIIIIIIIIIRCLTVFIDCIVSTLFEIVHRKDYMKAISVHTINNSSSSDNDDVDDDDDDDDDIHPAGDEHHLPGI